MQGENPANKKKEKSSAPWKICEGSPDEQNCYMFCTGQGYEISKATEHVGARNAFMHRAC